MRTTLLALCLALALPALAVADDDGGGSLRVGTCKREITPISPSLTGAYQAAFGVPGVPNHTDPVFMAGFGNNRQANAYHDRMWARGVVIDRKGKRVAIVSVDLIGYFKNEVDTIRGLVSPASDVDFVLVSSTHQHEGGKHKIKVASEKLKKLNSTTKIICHDTFLTRTNAVEILADYDLIIDASDNFATRYLINDACVILKKPFVSGAIHGFEGQLSVFNYKDGPTYRCLFPTVPEPHSIPDCNENGVLGVTPGIIGTLQALEAVKLITETGELLSGKLLLFNGLDLTIRKINFPVDLKNKQRTNLEPNYEPVVCDARDLIAINALVELLNNSGSLDLIDVRTMDEFKQESIEGALHVPLHELLSYFDINPPKGPLYFICQTGIRSQKAIQILREKYPNTPLYSVIGGMTAWVKQVSAPGKE